MKTVSKEIQDLSIQSLESTYNKLANAYESMVKKGSNTTLVKKRRDAIKIALESLDATWNEASFYYAKEVIVTTKEVLQSLIPSIETQLVKASSSQKTLNERRLYAIELAIESLESRLK